MWMTRVQEAYTGLKYVLINLSTYGLVGSPVVDVCHFPGAFPVIDMNEQKRDPKDKAYRTNNDIRDSQERIFSTQQGCC